MKYYITPKGKELLEGRSGGTNPRRVKATEDSRGRTTAMRNTRWPSRPLSDTEGVVSDPKPTKPDPAMKRAKKAMKR